MILNSSLSMTGLLMTRSNMFLNTKTRGSCISRKITGGRQAPGISAYTVRAEVYSNANFVVFGRFDRVTDFSSPKKDSEKDLYFVPMPSTMMHRKTAIEKTGLWDEHAIIRMGGEDWDLWLRFKDSLKIAHLDKVLTDYCLHGQNMNTGKIRRKEIVLTRAYVFTKRLKERMKTLGVVTALIKSGPEYMRIFE